MMTSINQAFHDYYDALPNKILPAVAQSAGITFAISFLFLKHNPDGVYNMAQPFLQAGVAALASTIHALMTPLFDQAFGKSHTNKPIMELIRSCVVGAMASLLVGCIQQSSLQLTAIKIYYLISLNSLFAWLISVHQPLTDNSTYICVNI